MDINFTQHKQNIFQNFLQNNKYLQSNTPLQYSTNPYLNTPQLSYDTICFWEKPVKNPRVMTIDEFRKALSGYSNAEEVIDIISSEQDEELKNQKKQFALELYENKCFFENIIPKVLSSTTKDNIKFAKELCKDKNFPVFFISKILKHTTKDNVELARELHHSKHFPTSEISSILSYTTKDNIEIAREFCRDGDFLIYIIPEFLKYVTKDNAELARELLKDKTFPIDKVDYILKNTTKDNIKLAKELHNNKHFPKDKISEILEYTTKDNLELARELCKDKEFPKYTISGILEYTIEDNIELAKKLCRDKDFPKDKIQDILSEKYYEYKMTKSGLSKEFFKDKDIRYVLKYLTQDNISIFKKTIIPQIQKCFNHPELYFNEDYFNDKYLSNLFLRNMSIIINIAECIGPEAFDDLLRKRFDNAKDYFDECKDFTDKDYSLLKSMCEATKPDGKKFISIEKVDMINILATYISCELNTNKIQTMINNNALDLNELNKDILNHVLTKSGLSKKEIKNIPEEKLKMFDLKYIHLLVNELENDKNGTLKNLIKTITLPDFKAYIHDKNNPYGQANLKTKQMFKKHGLNYENWINSSKSNEVDFTVKDKNNERLQQIAYQIIEDIETLRKTKAKDFIDKHFSNGIKEDKFFIPANIENNQEKLKNFVKNIMTQFNTLWQRAEKNNNTKVLTIKSHLAQRIEDIKGFQKATGEKEINWKIKMWDRNPTKDIFQGNYSTCCIGMNGGNGAAMPHYILNTMFNMVEIVDNNTGKTVGNALCYYAKDEKGKTAFVIDNIEIANHHKLSNEKGVKLRNSIVEFAKNINGEVTGDKNTQIILGTNHNDVSTDDLKTNSSKFSILGDMDCDRIYVDFFGSWENKNINKIVAYYML